jgi:hypothetical protein
MLSPIHQYKTVATQFDENRLHIEVYDDRYLINISLKLGKLWGKVNNNWART